MTVEEIEDLLKVIGRKWDVPIFKALERGSLHYTEIKDAIPEIAGSTLTDTLRSMQYDGLIKYTSLSSTMRSTTYELTPLGREVWRGLQDTLCFLQHLKPKIDEARSSYVPPPRAWRRRKKSA